jgi:hypothetical protein
MPQSITERVQRAVQRRGRGAVFVPADFLALGSRAAIDVALHRLVRSGVIRRLARGVYDFPIQHPVLGDLVPAIEQVAQALADRDGTRLLPTGAVAANALGLSDQVPARVVFLTDGKSRTVQIGPTTIQFRHTTPKNLATAGRLSGMLIQALRAVGRANLTPARRHQLRRTIPAAQRRKLLDDLRFAPSWMHPIFRELAEDEE